MATQTDKVYAAEAMMRPHRLFTNLVEIQHYVNSIVTSNWWQRRYPGTRTVYVEEGKRSSKWATGANYDNTHYGYGVVTLPPTSFDEITLIHEIAHTVTDRRVTHGPKFILNYLYLMDQVCGPGQAKELKRLLQGQGIRL